jgi:hypothetical protein
MRILQATPGLPMSRSLTSLPSVSLAAGPTASFPASAISPGSSAYHTQRRAMELLRSWALFLTRQGRGTFTAPNGPPS